MKKIFLLSISWICTGFLYAQNIGIGVNGPVEKLDINGALKLGTTTGQHTGTIRWNPDRNDFEGYNGVAWVSLTGSQGGWGQTDTYAFENGGTDFLLYHQDPFFGAGLGHSIDATEDFIFAGAYDDFTPSGIASAGMVYVITRTPDHWKAYPDFEFSSPNPTASEFFGFSLDRSDEYLLVGAPGWSNRKGRTYIYSFDPNGAQILHATLNQLDGSNEDHFGFSVGMTDDFAFVGAPWKDFGGVDNCGRVTIFKRNPATNAFSMFTNLITPDAATDDVFGKVISVSGNIAAIAAPWKDINGLQDQGKVYLYQWNGSTWPLMESITAPDPAAKDEFGAALCLKGDTLFVGATQANSSVAGHHGKVYFYLRSGNQWIYQSTIVASDGAIYNHFGNSISFRNGDLLIGAPRASIGLLESVGKAYMYRFNGTSWIQQAIFSASNRSSDDNFGFATTIANQTAIIGAPSAAVGFVPDNGRLYYFYK